MARVAVHEITVTFKHHREINLHITNLKDFLNVMYEEIMTNDDNLESNLLTSILLKMHSLYKFSYKLSRRFHVMNRLHNWRVTAIYTISVKLIMQRE